jgi:hypothetical protein
MLDSDGDVVTFCGGWSKPPQGHAIMYCIERTGPSFAWVVINTGEGINYHPSTFAYERDESAGGPRRRFRSAVRIENIPEEKILDDVFLYVLWRLRAFMDPLHTPKVVYEVLIPHACGKTMLQSWADGERAHPGLQGDFETPQRAGTCYYRCVLAAARYLLKRRGIPKAAIKQLTYVVRQKFVVGIERALVREAPSVLDESHHRLVQISLQQTALASLKERRAGRLDVQGLRTVQQLLSRVEQRLHEIPIYPFPSCPEPLHMAEWEKANRMPGRDGAALLRQDYRAVPGLHLLHDGDDAVFRGGSVDAITQAPIDFLGVSRGLPPWPPPVNDIHDALATIGRTLSILKAQREQAGARSIVPTEKVFMMQALITDLVINVLPTPLPQATPGIRSTCLWATSLPRVTQRKLLLDLYDLHSIFTLCTKQLPPRPLPHAVWSANCVTSTALLAMFDAVLRTPAADVTLPITAILRQRSGGWQISFKSFDHTEFQQLSNSFVLETPAQALSRTCLCEYIRSTTCGRVAFDFQPGEKGKKSMFMVQNGDPTLHFWGMLLDEYGVRGMPPSIRMAIEESARQFQSRKPGAELLDPGSFTETERLCGWLWDDEVAHNSHAGWQFKNRGDTLNKLFKLDCCPEARLLRNIVLNHKVCLQRCDSPPLERGEFQLGHDRASIRWDAEYSPVNGCQVGKIHIKCGAFGVDHDAGLIFITDPPHISPASLSHPMFQGSGSAPAGGVERIFRSTNGSMLDASLVDKLCTLSEASTEDDIVECAVLPTWDGLLSQSDAELLLSFLTVPMLRLPLIMDFFSSRLELLFNSSMREILESVLLEPGRWVERRVESSISTVPGSPEELADWRGCLLNELSTAAGSLSTSLLKLMQETRSLPPGNYHCPHVDCLLFIVRLIVYVQSYVLEAFKIVEPSCQQHLVELASSLASFLSIEANAPDSTMGVVQGWLSQAEEDEHVGSQSKLRAHMVMAASNLGQPHAPPFTATSCALTLSHFTFVFKWHTFDFSGGTGATSATDDAFDSASVSLGISDATMYYLFQVLRPRLVASFTVLPIESQEQALHQVVRAATKTSLAAWSTEVSDADQADDSIVQAAVNMGFSLATSRAAALATGNTCPQAAVEWCLNHSSDPVPSATGLILNDQTFVVSRQTKGAPGQGSASFHLQTAVLFASKGQAMAPVPEAITSMRGYSARFGATVLQCEHVEKSQNVEVVQLIGLPVRLSKWNAFKKARSIPTPIGWPKTPSSGSRTWMYYGKKYSRQVGSLSAPDFTLLAHSERWAVETLANVVRAEHATEKNSRLTETEWGIHLQELELEATLEMAVLLLVSHVKVRGGTITQFAECRVIRRGVVEIYNLVEHGRYVYPSLAYTSNSAVSLCDRITDVQSGDDELEKPLANCIQFHSGVMAIAAEPVTAPSLVIEHMCRGQWLKLMPRELLEGTIPASLLDHFSWWWSEDAQVLHGLIEDKTVAEDQQSAGWYDYSLEVTLVDGSTGTIKRKPRQVRAPAHDSLDRTTTQAARQVMGLQRQVSHFSDTPTSDVKCQVLRDLLHVEADSLLGRLGSLFARIENLGYVLCWGSADMPSTIELIELPRLKLRFEPKNDATGQMRLFSTEFSDLYIADDKLGLDPQLLACTPFSLVLRNTQGDYFILLPTYPVIRPKIKACPFTSRLVPDRSNLDWQRICATRHFIYPVHDSGKFIKFPSWASSVHFTKFAMMRRDYVLAARLIESCDTDKNLSQEEQWFWQQLSSTCEDKSDCHPDGIAIRLRLSLAVCYCPNAPQVWNVSEEMQSYVTKLSHVSRECRLSTDEELMLGSDPQRCEYIQADRDTASFVSMPCTDTKDGGSDFRQLQLKAIGGLRRQETWQWDSKLQYGRPVGKDIQEVIDLLWKDDIVGTNSSLGLCCLLELFQANSELGFDRARARSIAQLMTRMLWLTAEEKDKEKPFPFHVLYAVDMGVSDMLTYSAEYIQKFKDGAPTRDAKIMRNCQNDHCALGPRSSQRRTPLPRGACPSCGETPGRPSFPPLQADLSDVAASGFALLHSQMPPPYHAVDTNAVAKYASTTPKCKLHALSLGAPSFGNFRKTFHQEPSCDEFLGRTLDLMARKFTTATRASAPHEADLPFNISSHPSAKPVVAENMLAQLSHSMKAYQRYQTAHTEVQLNGSNSDEKLACVQQCLDDLTRMQEHERIKAFTLTYSVVDLANQCAALTEDDLEFWLSRCSGIDCKVSLYHIIAASMSSEASLELQGINRTLSQDFCLEILKQVTEMQLRVNRVAQINRCIALSRKLESSIQRKCEGYPIDTRLLDQTDAALCQALCAERVGPSGSFDPRRVCFEFLNGWLLKQRQVDLVSDFVAKALQGKSSVQQMLMGEGKTTCIAPLLALCLADTKTMVTQVVPDSLLEQSRDVMWSAFSVIITKRILTLAFDRSSCSSSVEVEQLIKKLHYTRRTGGIVITTATAIKSLMLKFVEVQRRLAMADAEVLQAVTLNDKQIRKPRLKTEVTKLKGAIDASDKLAEVLRVWKTGFLLADEVDMLLHPLKSELNFPIGNKKRLEPWSLRWGMSMVCLESLFGNAQLTAVLEEGYRLRHLQRKPHLILLNKGFYHQKLRPILNTILFEYLVKQHRDGKSVLEAPGVDKSHVAAYLSGQEADQAISDHMTKEQVCLLNLGRDLLSTYIPHVLTKIDRVSFGLLSDLDIANRAGAPIPENRLLLAVPFVGKDVPSNSAEFAHPDVVIGLTILAYRYEGLRRDHVKKILAKLKQQYKQQIGNQPDRPAQRLLDCWIGHASQQLYLPRAHFALDYYQPEDEDALDDLFSYLSHAEFGDYMDGTESHPSPSKWLLLESVFPRCMKYQVQKLSASGQALGSDSIFGVRLGFSGTPSDLLPRSLGTCGFEETSAGKILTTLCQHCSVKKCSSDWSVEELLISKCIHGAVAAGAVLMIILRRYCHCITTCACAHRHRCPYNWYG